MNAKQKFHAANNHPRMRQLRRRLAPYSFAIFITGAVTLAIGVTLLNMALYVSSGASSIDISRPSYQAVRDSIGTDKEETSDFDSSSKISTKTIDLFKKLESEAAATRANVSGHGEKSIEDESLGIPPAGDQ